MTSGGNIQEEQIERYLLGKMSEEELAAFHLELLKDPRLRREVEVMQAVVKRSKSAKVTALFSKKTHIFLIGSAVIFLFFVFFLISSLANPPKAATSKEMNQPEENSYFIDSSNMGEVFLEKNAQKAPESKMADSVDLFEKETTRTEKPSRPKNERAFIPNLYLEQFINTPFRDATTNLELNQVTSELTGTDNQKPEFRLEGTLSGVLQEEQHLQLIILSNKPSDFENARYLLAQEMSLEKAGETYRFSFRGKLDLDPGLYYYLLLFSSTEEPLTIGKFTIQ